MVRKRLGQQRRKKRPLDALSVRRLCHHQVHLDTELSRENERVIAFEAGEKAERSDASSQPSLRL